MERRRTKRRPILATFSLFVVVPQKGPHRLSVHDVSDLGIGFDLDTEGEIETDFPLKQGERLQLHFYLNQSLFLPISVQVARLDREGEIRRVGGEIVDKKGKPLEAFQAFIQMLDAVSEAVEIK